MWTLSKYRSNFKKYSWTLWAVIVAFVGGFILTDAFQKKDQVQSGLIFINDKPVIQGAEYQRELMRTLARYKEQLKENFNKSLINQFGIPERLLQNFIHMAIIKKEAEKMNISASAEEVRNKIFNHPYLQMNGQFVGLERYRQFVRTMQMKPEEFESQLGDEVIREKFQELVTGPLVIDKDTLKEMYQKEKDQVELDYILLTPDRIKTDPTVQDTEIGAFYQEHKEDFKSQEKRAGQMIALNSEDYKKEIILGEQEPYDYFMSHKDEFRVPGKIRVSRIFLKYNEQNREEILQKATQLKAELTKDNFAQTAQNVSEDEKAQEGGDYGYTAWKQFTTQEQGLINSMKENEISPPVDTLHNGFSILYLPEKISELQQRFKEVQTQIVDSLLQERVKALIEDKLKKIQAKINNNNDLKSQAGELGLTIIETESLTNGQPIKDLDEMGYISRALFSLEKEKDIKSPVQYVKGLALVQLTTITKPEVLPLEQVKDQVQKQVALSKKAIMIQEEAAQLSITLNNLKDDNEVQEALKKQDLATSPLTYKRGDKFSHFPTQSGLDNKIFNMEPGNFSTPIAFDNDIVIIKVKSKKISTEEEFQKEKQDFYARKIGEMKDSYFMSFILNKKDAYRVAINSEMYNQIKEWALGQVY